jgi:hypothetical protein
MILLVDLCFKGAPQIEYTEQSRVWLCPTTVSFSVPLHAIGQSGQKVVIGSSSRTCTSSYTPTLRTLIQSRKTAGAAIGQVLVIQPDVKMPYLGNGKHIAVLEHLRDCEIFHISCHGCLETGRPFDAFLFFRLAIWPSSWKRHRQRPCGGSPILRVPRRCQDRDHVANGRRWRTTPYREHYRPAFSDRWQRTPYYERTSEALGDAGRVLKKRNVSLERWVNFFHFSA